MKQGRECNTNEMDHHFDNDTTGMEALVKQWGQRQRWKDDMTQLSTGQVIELLATRLEKALEATAAGEGGMRLCDRMGDALSHVALLWTMSANEPRYHESSFINSIEGITAEHHTPTAEERIAQLDRRWTEDDLRRRQGDKPFYAWVWIGDIKDPRLRVRARVLFDSGCSLVACSDALVEKLHA